MPTDRSSEQNGNSQCTDEMIKKHAIIIATLLLTTATQARAWPFDEPPYVWIGADAQITRSNHGYSIFCNGTAIDTANIGIGQVLKRTERTEWIAQWTHHSCISQAHDRNGYDGIGIIVRIHLW